MREYWIPALMSSELARGGAPLRLAATGVAAQSTNFGIFVCEIWHDLAPLCSTMHALKW